MVIADQHGKTINYQPSAQICTDFRLQTYRGRRLLTWFEEQPEDDNPTGGAGTDYLADPSFNVIHSIGSLGALSPDLHEFRLTSQNTALITVYQEIPYDLSPVGGPVNGQLYDSLWLEVELPSKKVLRSWRASDHVDLTETYGKVPEKEAFDYLHINSVAEDVDGHILISARCTWAIYKINRFTGEIMWRMGGKKSDFSLPGNATFCGQHDVQAVDATTLRVFDNGSDGSTTQNPYSRVLWLRPDFANQRVQLEREVYHPDKILAEAMGNAQALPNGNTLVGWGSSARMSEFDPAGKLVFDATLPRLCYRVYRNAA